MISNQSLKDISIMEDEKGIIIFTTVSQIEYKDDLIYSISQIKDLYQVNSFVRMN